MLLLCHGLQESLIVVCLMNDWQAACPALQQSPEMPEIFVTPTGARMSRHIFKVLLLLPQAERLLAWLQKMVF